MGTGTGVAYRIGLLGLGTVGTGVVQILQDPQSRHPLLRATQIQKVGVRSLDKARDVSLDPALLTTDLQAIVQDPEVDIVVELIGGLEPARSLILSAIAQGKHVVTANKAVIARHGTEIFAAAQQTGVYVLLDAAVGGGIPVIQSLKQSLVANRLQTVMAIINGTTNFILTQMSLHQASFADALALAQAKGYAEADPSADVEGWDAADKIAILASIAFGAQIDRQAILCEGIRNVTASDIRYAAEWGYTIKLIALAQRSLNQPELDVRVHPALLPHAHPLASVNYEDNAVLVLGDPVGQVMLFGPGAGRGPTASAVVADLLTIMAALQMATPLSNPLLLTTATDPAPLLSPQATRSEFYVRVLAQDQPGVIGAIGTCFGAHQVSLECIMQKASHEQQAEIVIMTHTVSAGAFLQAIEEIRHLPAVVDIPSVFRVLPDTHQLVDP